MSNSVDLDDGLDDLSENEHKLLDRLANDRQKTTRQRLGMQPRENWTNDKNEDTPIIVQTNNTPSR